MTASVHQEFLEISTQICKPFHAALEQNGPVKLRRRSKNACFITTLCRAVAGQQLSTAASTTIWNRVLSLVDEEQGIAQCIAQSPEQVLKDCGLSRAKVKAMKAISEAKQSGLLEVQDLARKSHWERSQSLTSIWGVGQWTADMVGIFFFGDKDVWPSGDITVCKTLQQLVGKRRSLEKVADHFRPKRSYLAIYMYSIADADPN